MTPQSQGTTDALKSPMNLQGLMLSDKSQPPKVRHGLIPFVQSSRNDECIGIVAMGEGGSGVTIKGNMKNLCRNGDIPYIDCINISNPTEILYYRYSRYLPTLGRS